MAEEAALIGLAVTPTVGEEVVGAPVTCVGFKEILQHGLLWPGAVEVGRRHDYLLQLYI